MVAPSLAFALFLATAPAPRDETRLSLDVRDAAIVDIVSLLAELADLQVVFDPGISCPLTLKLHDVPWRAALAASLRACRLSVEEENGIVRIATAERLIGEARARRELEEAREAARPRSVTSFRLSYARAAEMAPLVQKLLGPNASVVLDPRTNTLIVID